ncbi:hypothetical protein SALBM135S_04054 [Streptomyces alboniger]
MALLWLPGAPRAARAALLGLAPLWPVAMAAGDYTGPVLLPPALSLAATCAAAASGRVGPAGTVPPSAVWFSLPAVVVHAGAATAAVLDRGTPAPAWAVGVGATAGAALAIGAATWCGVLRGRRERADRGERERRLAAWTEEAVRDAWAERRRIAAGLETTVLARTSDVVAEAEAGRLEATAERAREALAAMRALLDTVRDGEAEPRLRPQPTLKALDLLAQQCRATGRDVELHLTDRVPEHLPAAVDLAAYSAAETLLATEDETPAELRLDVSDAGLLLSATGVPRAAASPAVRERLAARIEPLGGTVTVDGAGTVRVVLPLGPTGREVDGR